MRRVLFHIGRMPVYSYPAMLYAGIVLGIYAQLYAGRSIGIDSVRLLTATLFLLTCALLGARLLFVAANWETYRRQPRRILRCSDGGAAMYGGLFVAVPLSAAVTEMVRIPFAAFWDLASFTMLVGMIVTRAGCFLNGCCAGRPTQGWFALRLPDDAGVWERRIPNQLLEAACGLLVLAGAVLLWRRLPFSGAVILYTFGAYGAGRVVLEPLRDVQDRVQGIRLQRAISMALVVLALTGYSIAWVR